MIKESEKVKRKLPLESETTSLKKIKLTVSSSEPSNSSQPKAPSQADSKFSVSISKIVLHQDREKGIQLFKSVLLSDYSKTEITEEFEQHVEDIAYHIENGNWDLLIEVFRKSGMSCAEKIYKESIRGLFINLKVGGIWRAEG